VLDSTSAPTDQQTIDACLLVVWCVAEELSRTG